jgi:transposase
MLSLPSALRIYICPQPTDMRKSFDALAIMVQHIIGQDPLSGYIFVFTNKPGNKLKCLYWDTDGYALWYKRLEKGTFTLPELADDMSIDYRNFTMMLQGLKLRNIALKPRFKLK